MSVKTRYASVGALVLACTALAHSVQAKATQKEGCFQAKPVHIYSFESTGFRRSADGRLIFSFRMNLQISKNVEVSIHTIDGVDDEWNLTSRSREPFEFEIKSYLRGFPAPPNNKMSVHVSFCLIDGDLTVNLQNRPSPPMRCPGFVVIDSRGSDEPFGQFSAPGQVFVNKFKEMNGDERIGLLDNPYPAAGRWSMVGAYLKLSWVGKYHASVVEGKKWLSAQVQHWSTACPASKLVLTGYSQGAQVTGDVDHELGSMIWAIVLFGDPYFNSEDGWRNDWSFSDFQHGRLGERPALVGGYTKIVSFCHAKDPICQNLSVKETLAVLDKHHRPTWHENYQSLGEPEAAAQYLSR